MSIGAALVDAPCASVTVSAALYVPACRNVIDGLAAVDRATTAPRCVIVHS